MKFLIDECLSVDLVRVANDRGFAAAHVVYVGLSGKGDLVIAQYAFDNDYAIVTNNAVDFRRILRASGVHPGLVIIIPSAPLDVQVELFGLLLADIEAHGTDLVNMAVDVSFTDISYYPLP